MQSGIIAPSSLGRQNELWNIITRNRSLRLGRYESLEEEFTAGRVSRDWQFRGPGGAQPITLDDLLTRERALRTVAAMRTSSAPPPPTTEETASPVGNFVALIAIAFAILYVGGWSPLWAAHRYSEQAYSIMDNGFAVRINGLYYGATFKSRFFDSPAISWICLFIASGTTPGLLVFGTDGKSTDSSDSG